MWPAQAKPWSDPVTSTPSIIQIDFGSWGENLPGDGEMYCGPTSIVMGLYYLYANGFTQVAPAAFASQDVPATVDLELAIAGLLNTSVSGGTSSSNLAGVEDYLSACGIGPERYSIASTGNPDLAWIANQIAPNVAPNPSVIVLSLFLVSWYEWNEDRTELLNVGGHFLVPLTANQMASQLTLNNPFPSSFADVPNQPGSNPQTVGLAPVPPSWVDAAQFLDLSIPVSIAPGVSSMVSLAYTQVKSQKEGQKNSYAILCGGQAWAIDRTATPDHPPSQWNLSGEKLINTNGGALNVIAPLMGSGGLVKMGPGTLCLSNDNSLTGDNWVRAGVLMSAASTSAPFGTGAIGISGGGVLAVSIAGVAKLTIASGPSARLVIGPGAVLQVNGLSQCCLTIGGYDDGLTPNLVRQTAGTLIISLDAGIDQLGGNQILMIQGTGANLPVVTNGMVEPYIVGQSTDGMSAGFLNYSNESGFQAASTVSSADVDIGSVAPDAIYEVVNTQEVPSGQSAAVAALEMNGGTIEGSGTVQVGSQVSGACAGVLMNAGTIANGSLSFGSAEGVIYTCNGAPGIISASITGSGGLTTFGPGTLILQADNSTTLSGPINVASQPAPLSSGLSVLIAAGDGSATGSGDVVVNEAAQLTISGSVAGNVSVGYNGIVLLQEGTIQKGLTTDAEGESSAIRGGILQGTGVVEGPVTLLGLIQSGPTAGLLTFNGGAFVGGGAAGFYWRLQSLVDNSNSSPGVGWNALVFTGKTVFGTAGANVAFYLDFSALGSDPDGSPANPFWNTAHTWTLVTFPEGAQIYWQPENFAYGAGNFDIDVDWAGQAVKLTWTPASTTQSLLQRMAKRAELRRKAAFTAHRPVT